MQKWEYSFLVRDWAKVTGDAAFIGPDGIKRDCSHIVSDMLRELNKLGAEGWEVVGYGTSGSHLFAYQAIWTLKRPKQ
jgi:hypothetical protein